MIYQSLCRPEKSFFLKVQRSGLKKSGNEDFEVPIGCFNGAEIRELVGIYRQSKLTNIINKEKVGLYREDGLGTFKNISRPQIKGKKKAIVKMFKKWELSIVVDTNLKTADFLTMTFDLDKIYIQTLLKA